MVIMLVRCHKASESETIKLESDRPRKRENNKMAELSYAQVPYDNNDPQRKTFFMNLLSRYQIMRPC